MTADDKLAVWDEFVSIATPAERRAYTDSLARLDRIADPTMRDRLKLASLRGYLAAARKRATPTEAPAGVDQYGEPVAYDAHDIDGRCGTCAGVGWIALGDNAATPCRTCNLPAARRLRVGHLGCRRRGCDTCANADQDPPADRDRTRPTRNPFTSPS